MPDISLLKQIISKNIKKLEKKFTTINLISIDERQILKNFDFFKQQYPDHTIWPVLKSNAYGHGLAQITQILSKRRIDYLVVDSYLEALQIWQINPKQKVLLIGSILPENFKNLKLDKIAPTIFDLDCLIALGQLGKPAKIHLKINTGFNRQGLKYEEVGEFLEILRKYPQIELEGLMSHLADADNPQQTFTKKQRENFSKTIALVRKMGFSPKYIHLDATAGSSNLDKTQTNALRLGIGLYGFNPLPKNRSSYTKFEILKPALEFTSKIINVVELKKGDQVGYGCTFTASKPMEVGILPVGYFEVFDRKLSNKGFVKYKNQFLPIVGRVCMNLTIVDLKETNAKRWDEIQIISPQTKDKNSAQNMAQFSDTIVYETLVKINASTRRRVK